MSLEAPQLNRITQISNLAKEALLMEGQINQIDILFNGVPNWAALVTQPNIDAIGSFKSAGLTAQNVLDAIYILKQMRVQILANLPALVELANL